MCLRIVDEKWVLTWFNAGLYRVDALVADSPTDIGQHPFSETLLWGCNWGQEDDERVAQLYGPYVLPGSTLDDLHLLCSQWNTEEGWPYHVHQYRVQGLGEGVRSRGSSRCAAAVTRPTRIHPGPGRRRSTGTWLLGSRRSRCCPSRTRRSRCRSSARSPPHGSWPARSGP